jgi:hypothetical protein
LGTRDMAAVMKFSKEMAKTVEKRYTTKFL